MVDFPSQALRSQEVDDEPMPGKKVVFVYDCLRFTRMDMPQKEAFENRILGLKGGRKASRYRE
jgi:hypothetical protein